MARPQKDTTAKQTRRLPIRCTEAEYTSIQTRAKDLGMSVSGYVRHMAINGEVIINENNAPFDFAFVNQLQKIGVNINQQTKKLHATDRLPPELRRLWTKLETTLDHIIEKL